MHILCFFDLPTETAKDRRQYRIFRRFLIKNGFIMLEESVYERMVVNSHGQRALVELLRKNKPPKGLVMILQITDKQFENMDIITGEFKSNVINTTERVVEL
jgi:CRISPR-associated protein Cas2